MSFSLVQHLTSHNLKPSSSSWERPFQSQPQVADPSQIYCSCIQDLSDRVLETKKTCGFFSFLLFLFKSSYILLHLLLLFSHLSFNFFPLPAKPKSEAPFATMFPSVTVLSQVLARYALFCSMHRFVALCCKNRCSENGNMLSIWPLCLWSSRSHKSW